MKPAPKGWCPGALRPLMSGDGLIVRVKPRLCRFTASEIFGLCEAATRWGSGALEITRRANLQIRGVAPEGHPALVGALARLGLLDPDDGIEARRNLIVTPFWQEGDPTARIASGLAARLATLPPLPAKWGWVVDCGAALALDSAPGDVRIERGASGGLIVRADGAGEGRATTEARAVDDALALARWFSATGGAAAGRMARHLAALPPGRHPEAGELPAPAVALAPGPSPLGPVLGLPFGLIDASVLADLVRRSGAAAIRLTPWRMIVLEGGRAVHAPGLAAAPGDPAMAVDACPGAPACASASVATRPLALRLAGQAWGRLHVSGCAKGCARDRPAAITLVGRDGRFDLVRGGRAWDAPERTGLTAEAAARIIEGESDAL